MLFGQRMRECKSDACTRLSLAGCGIGSEEGREYLLTKLGRHCRSVIKTSNKKVVVVGSEAHLDYLLTIFYSIVDEVAYDLGKSLFVDKGIDIFVGHVESRLNRLAAHQWSEPYEHALNDIIDVATLEVEPYTILLYLTEVEQLVGKVKQSRHVLVHDGEVFLLLVAFLVSV